MAMKTGRGNWRRRERRTGSVRVVAGLLLPALLALWAVVPSARAQEGAAEIHPEEIHSPVNLDENIVSSSHHDAQELLSEFEDGHVDVPLDEGVEPEEDADADDLGTRAKVRQHPRTPFHLLEYDETYEMWVPAVKESMAMQELVHQAFNIFSHQPEEDSRSPEAKTVQARDLNWFVETVINPDDQPITAEERELIHAQVQQLREEEGLLDDSKRLFLGYLSRGKPLKVMHRILTMLNERFYNREETTDMAPTRQQISGMISDAAVPL